ncbi:epidermal growth factor-like protein isoform X1 [Drosophila takahashii]|uniref:epidermal growth factor-like protein isoform X1 n=1 Tax=Drosophila takahashii TaxID=29030 RepID=UPI001CF8FF2A|nr:cell death abnormality protein 1 isoform X1 [Drosophila takahashii]
MQFSGPLAVFTALLTLVAFPALIQADSTELYGDIENTEYGDFESLSQTREQQKHLCHREVPTVFFQTEKDSPVRGNGSTIYYHRIEVCCAGYRRDAHSQDCVPDCSESSPDNCRNGFCRSPGNCECFAEFVRNEQGACIHTCPIACQYGRCYLNGTCACHRGFVLDQDTRQFCRPQCSQACGTHEECVAPGQCDCSPGYRRTADLGCQPVCAPDCGFGKCVAPNQCDCFAGFIKRPNRNVCEAECYLNCENGFCESRYKCHCREGYHYNVNTTSCLPVCIDNCGQGNGVCIAPGVCRCFEGYEAHGADCRPKCQRSCGKFGRCVAPEICGCGQGQQHCRNGSCDDVEHCTCPAGETHFIDRCLKPDQLIQQLNTSEKRKHFNRQLAYEFNALIGRLFNF